VQTTGNFDLNLNYSSMKTRFVLSVLLFVLYSPFLLSSTTKKENDEKPASVSMTGKVIDHKSGEALAGVLLEFEELGARIYTDFEGKFQLNDLAPGRYYLTTSFISYDSQELDLELVSENTEPVKIELIQISRIVP